jgi:hypothetical protein
MTITSWSWSYDSWIYNYLCNQCLSPLPLWGVLDSWLIIGFVTRLTRQMLLVQQELLTLPEHPRSPPVFSGVRVIRSLAWCVCFVYRCLSCTFSFGHCVVCSLIYGYWLPLWYLQTLLKKIIHSSNNGVIDVRGTC